MRKFIVVAAAILLILGLLGLRLWSGLGSARVRIAYPPMMASLPVFVAEDQQLFARQGVKPQTIAFSSSNDMVNALVAGQIDLLPAVSLVPLVHLEIQHPGKVRIFSHSRMRPDNANYRIVVPSASPVRALHDLRGRKLGVFPGTSATRLVSVFFRKQGVDPESITFVQLPPAAQISSLESGAVDALFAYDPLILTAPPGKYRALSNSVYAELIDPCPLGVSVVSREFERKRPATAAHAIRVIQQGISFMGAHPEQARALLPKFTKMTPEVASRVNVADVTLSNDVDVATLQRFIDLLYDSGEIPEKIDAHRLVDPTR
jgi:ABC-type nitrate/sulfonate/bicarbonate transport system substrate-binding protein